MNWRVILGNLGTMLRLFSLMLLVPAALSLVFEPRTVSLWFSLGVAETTLPFVYTFLGALGTGFLLERVGTATDFRDKEAYVLVGLSWIVLTVVAAVPYVLTGVLESPTDAFFEAMSGITTTGATLITVPLEGLPAGIHIWRAMTQWLGGMGIIVLTVAVLSRFASAGARLIRAEVPGGKVQRIAPSIRETASSLWRVYAGVSLVVFLILLGLFYQQIGSWHVAGLDALVHAFTVMPTGGFSTQTLSIEAYDAPLLEIFLIAVMIIAGTNFALLYKAFRGEVRALLDDDEWRFFLSILAVGTVLLTVALLMGPETAAFWADHGGRSVLTSIRLAAFQAVSLITTTGYSTSNFDAWPEMARYLALFFMFVGGSAGSTGGSVKIVRVLIMFRVLKVELRRIAHPRAVLPIRLRGESIPGPDLQRVMVFIFAYVTLFVAGTLLILALEPMTVLDGASAVAATLGNVGPALGTVGPHVGYASLTTGGKMLLSLLMWVGRLEIFAVLVLFNPETYR